MREPVLLGEFAKLIRSKNAGPFWITFDIMFANDTNFKRVVSAKVLTKSWIAKTYQIPEDSVIFVEITVASAIKFCFLDLEFKVILVKPICTPDSSMRRC
jgi:hypothetical protein